MTVAARSIRKLMWFSCFTSSGGSGLVGLGKEIKKSREIIKETFSLLYVSLIVGILFSILRKYYVEIKNIYFIISI